MKQEIINSTKIILLVLVLHKVRIVKLERLFSPGTFKSWPLRM